jgi:23S rRNA pseudouridine2605 synthase
MDSKARPLKTIDRVLSKAGVGSRTDARSWIGAGRVAVNGRVIQTPDQWVDLERDRVTLDGRPIRVDKKNKRYIVLYKPKGYVTTYKDPEGRPTVYDLLEGIEEFVFPVGRLDLDTSGLLLLSNDSQFAEYISNPEHKVPKTYLVKTGSVLDDAAIEQLRHGVLLSDGATRPATVERIRDSATSRPWAARFENLYAPRLGPSALALLKSVSGGK